MRRSVYYPLEKLLPVANWSIYKLTMLIAKRAMMIADGDKPAIDNPSEKPLECALQEIISGKIILKEKK